jgi:hypothetical protein
MCSILFFDLLCDVENLDTLRSDASQHLPSYCPLLRFDPRLCNLMVWVQSSLSFAKDAGHRQQRHAWLTNMHLAS